MMKFGFFVLLFLLSFSVRGDALDSTMSAKALAEAVMDLVAAGKTPEGLELMKPYLIIPESEFEVMKEQLKLQMPMIQSRFGNTVSVELIKAEEVGESLYLVIYIQKFEKHMMRWMFYFYKPRDKWILNTFNTDDKIQNMFSDN